MGCIALYLIGKVIAPTMMAFMHIAHSLAFNLGYVLGVRLFGRRWRRHYACVHLAANTALTFLGLLLASVARLVASDRPSSLDSYLMGDWASHDILSDAVNSYPGIGIRFVRRRGRLRWSSFLTGFSSEVSSGWISNERVQVSSVILALLETMECVDSVYLVGFL